MMQLQDELKHRYRDAQEHAKRWVASFEQSDMLVDVSQRRRRAFHGLGHLIVTFALEDRPISAKTFRLREIADCCQWTDVNRKRAMVQTELENRLTILLGGRAAEVLCFDEASDLSSGDLCEVTQIARNMVMRFGMNTSLGLVSYETPADTRYPGPSEETLRLIDHDVQGQLNRAFGKACEKLEFARPFIERYAERLVRGGSVNLERMRSAWREFEGQRSKTGSQVSEQEAEVVLMH
jgi:cell division protease FtsH